MSFAECVKLAGGATVDKPFVLAGGPLMGKSVNDLENESVTKTTSGIIVLPAGHYLERRRAISIEHIQNRARSACIKCSTCSDMCPRRLLGSPLRPHLVMRALAASTDMDDLLKTEAAQSAMLCCECGICETYACPMELQPCRVNIMLKAEMRKRGLKPNYAEAGEPLPERAFRKVPSKRIAARAGVLSYWEGPFYEGTAEERDRFIDVPACACVSIPLKMQAGAASLPCVKPGDRVKAGQLIAKIPEGSLGANIHASIDGVVQALANDRIVIKNEEAGA
jgi:Na+-translocating ferredoxin:NAD+ oxidoreductase RnfC subunit